MLRQILVKYGKEICSDVRRCQGLLNDLCGSYRREINVLVNAIEERIPLDLLAAANSMPPELLLTRLEKQAWRPDGINGGSGAVGGRIMGVGTRCGDGRGDWSKRAKTI